MITPIVFHGRARVALAVFTSLFIAACQPAPKAASEPTAPQPAAAPVSETDRLNQFFDDIFERNLTRSPVRMTYLGMKDRYGEWNDFSDERVREDVELARADLAAMREGFDVAALTRQGRISYRLFEYAAERRIANFKWRFHNYPINQMFGMHSMVPVFLANYHRVDDESDAEAYIARLQAVGGLFAQVEEGLVKREQLGILPPAFVFPLVLDDIRNILVGAPFDDSSADNTMLADFRAKVAALEGLSDAREAELVAAARTALGEVVIPAYESLRRLLERQEKLASTDDGAWKLPDGDAYYDVSLGNYTTTSYDADDIHAFGLAEVARIHGEMRAIMTAVGFTGSLAEFFTFMREDARFYYSNDEAGRAKYMRDAKAIIDHMESRLDELFITKPRARMIVKRVEPFREKSAGKAFYSGPAPDGSREGIYYANLYNMRDMPSYQMEALAYHEGIPGHHMQIAIAQQMETLPKFRRFGGYSAFSEGWGLYAEFIPKEMGLYQDPYSDFGRLAMELWRACRLVVDTGIHRKRWTRQQAIDYLRENTPNPPGDVVKAIERYIVRPGQATAYKIGMRAILEMRADAQAKLGERFDLRGFHDVILTGGPMPLDVLREQVTRWAAEAAQ